MLYDINTLLDGDRYLFSEGISLQEENDESSSLVMWDLRSSYYSVIFIGSWL